MLAAILALPAGIVVGVAAIKIAPFFICRGDAQLKTAMLAYVIASAIAYLILDIRFGGRIGLAILRTILVAIIFFLPPGIAIPGLTSALDAERRQDAMRQMEEIGRAIEIFRADRGRYPAPAEIDLPPRDPWRHPYVVETNTTSWTLRSYGACGEPGARSSYRFEKDLVLRDSVWVSDQP